MSGGVLSVFTGLPLTKSNKPPLTRFLHSVSDSGKINIEEVAEKWSL